LCTVGHIGAHDIEGASRPQLPRRVSHREMCCRARETPHARAARTYASSPMRARFLAFDLGAESGRALSEVCRFPNEPVRVDGSLYWDAPRLWLHMEQALAQAAAGGDACASIGV